MGFKSKLMFVLNVFIISQNCYAQNEIGNYNSISDWNIDSSELHVLLNENFNGGIDNFYASIYNEIKYPLMASRNWKEGIALIQLAIENSKTKINFINKIGIEFEEEILRVFSKIESQWKSNVKILPMNISIKFSINPEKGLNMNEQAIIQITSYHMGSNLICDAICDYRTNEYLLEMANKSYDYKDYESTILYLKELIRRNPFNRDFQNLYYESWSKIIK